MALGGSGVNLVLNRPRGNRSLLTSVTAEVGCRVRTDDHELGFCLLSIRITCIPRPAVSNDVETWWKRPCVKSTFI